MAKSEQFAIWGAQAVCGNYTRNANAYQKIRMAVENLGAVLLVPRGACVDWTSELSVKPKIVEVDLSGGFGSCFRGKAHVTWIYRKLAKYCRAHSLTLILPVSNEFTLLGAALASRLVPVWLLCWDPPGVSVRNRRDFISRLRCRIMDFLMAYAIHQAKGLILNLHCGFAERFSLSVREKIHVFANGTDVSYNQRCAHGVEHIPGRVAVNNTFSADKGAWEIARSFIRLWRDDSTRSLIWVGAGNLVEDVRAYFLEEGIPTSAFELGKRPHPEAMRALASGSIALCMYNDVPSLRWNFILKAPEFMSLGLPTVCVDLPGTTEYIRENETGLLFASGNEEEAFEKTRWLLSDADETARMRANALSRVSQYDWAKINADIADLIRRLA